MKNWLFWAGIGFIVGGIIGYILTLGASGMINFSEDISGYSIGWIVAGIVLLVVGLIKK